MDQTQFNEALTSLIEYAAANGNNITKKDVELYFGNIIEDDSMYVPIFTYLKESKITVNDLDSEELINQDSVSDAIDNPYDDSNSDFPKDLRNEVNSITPKIESEKELKFIEMYKNDLAGIKSLEVSERKTLIENMKNGDSSAMAVLTEDCLSTVHEIATSFMGQGLTLGDLIQEGNIGLMLSLPEFDGEVEEFDEYIKEKIRESISEAISIQVNSERISSHLAQRMNSLDDISKELTEKLGHAPSVEELAEEMHISTDEVETIIRTSLNVLTVTGENAESDSNQ
ncbi:MAG: sigma-70 family RNA polymerase sigma factor [Lachnospiraceae bacterium]|nr:sigma-70 family RNA polymerase sigma factor [Lachnospiraceae bacterium]